MPSAHRYTNSSPHQSRSRHCAYSRSQPPLSRTIVAADKPFTDSSNSAVSASPKSFVDIPFRYSHGITASARLVFFKYGGNNSERKHRPAPDLSRVRGTRTRTGPTPVKTSRYGR